MEYILDLLLSVLIDGSTEPVEINHRVELLRPLSEVSQWLIWIFNSSESSR